MANTTNYNWETPDDTDLVKDGASAIRTLGNSIDTTTKALNPETTLGDIAYRSSTSNTNTRLPIGSNGQILGVSAGVPAWINNDQGDITEVQAGTGISVASGTGPIPVVTNTVATAYDAKADLIVGTGADTFAKLTVGANGTVLTADSSVSPTGLKWASPAGGGKVLQVVNATYNTSTTVASTTFADTGLSLSITPSAASSKILVFAEQSTYNESTNQATAVLEIRLLRDATSIQDFKGVSYVNIGATGGSNLLVRAPISYLDSPNTTSSVTYKMQGRVASTANSAQAIFQVSSSVSTITLLEIGA